MSISRTLIVALCVVTSSLTVTYATVVEVPTFDQMVARADLVFEGEVVATNSHWARGDTGPVIATTVTFDVVQLLKGSARSRVDLEFFGGTIGDERMGISGQTLFKVGDHDVLFLHEASGRFADLVGFSFGRFRVSRKAETGEAFVTTFDNRAFGSVENLGRPAPVATADPLPPVTLEAFTREISRRVLRRQ